MGSQTSKESFVKEEEQTVNEKRQKKGWIGILIGIILFAVLFVLIFVKSVANNPNSYWYLVLVGALATCSLCAGMAIVGSKSDRTTSRENIATFFFFILAAAAFSGMVVTLIPSFGYNYAAPVTLATIFIVAVSYYFTWTSIVESLKLAEGTRLVQGR